MPSETRVSSRLYFSAVAPTAASLRENYSSIIFSSVIPSPPCAFILYDGINRPVVTVRRIFGTFFFIVAQGSGLVNCIASLL